MAHLRDTLSRRPPDLLLQMDHWLEDLSPAQLSHYGRAEKECADIFFRMNELITKEGGEVLEKGHDVMVIQTSIESQPVPSLNSILASPNQPMGVNSNTVSVQLQQPPMPSIQAVPSQQLLIQSGPVQTSGRNARPTSTQVPAFTPTTGTFQLVMDPRLGIIVGAVPNVPNQPAPANQIVPSSTPPQPVPPTQVQQVTSNRQRSAPVPRTVVPKPSVTTGSPMVAKSSVTTGSSNPRSLIISTTSTSAASNTSTVTTHRNKSKTTTSVSVSPPVIASMPPPTIPASGNRPTENNSIGGLSAGSPGRKALHEERGAGPDSREVTFSKMSGKTFPSLVVIARPHLRMKEMSQVKVNQERSALDGKVKSVLMYTATKFTEWLIQQGLVRSEQYCTVHSSPNGSQKLKLGMYSDVTKFPYSGGYVWISECCPTRFVSVFSGSIFEGAPHPPSVLLKLMYHWCCQTNVQNVVQWVKVDNFYVKNFFTHMRSVCVAAVQELHEKLGGPKKKVEVGVISLGTTSQDGNMRQVKVEVLGVMDPESKLVRLRAVEPLQDGERNYKRRFVKILEPLEYWVHKDSIIVTDFTVDKGTLQSMGFNQVHQASIPESPPTSSSLTNHNIMEYLRRIVPRMFQNTLSLLSRQIIQQFLDELVWRERWGPVPSQAFDALVAHLAAQTKLDSGESLLLKLGKISLNPFRRWDYINWKNNGLSSTAAFTSVPTIGNSSQTSTPRIVNTFSSSNRPGVGVQKPQSKELTVLESSSGARPKISIALRKKFELKAGDDIAPQLELAVAKVEKGMSLRKAVLTYSVPRSILMERVKNFSKNRKYSDSNNIFSEDEEKDIVDHLFTLHEWGYPFGRWDIRLVVKQYLECLDCTEGKFKESFPGDMWIEKFLSRHPVLKEKLCRNIPSRGTFIDTDAVQQYVLNLSSIMNGVPSENIVNFMEVGLTGDPLRSMTVELRDLRYPVGKRKVKSSSSVMLCCTASGQMLPAYIIFEGRCVNVVKGPASGEYYGTKCGWFDECAFEQWLQSVLLPWADSIPGRKIIVGDSLAQLFTVKTQAICLDKDIRFVCMPCNVTNVLSPLDVVLFDKLKSNWRSTSRAISGSHCDKFITMEEFPAHIYELLCTTVGPDMPEKLQEAFKRVGLYPFDSKAILKSLEKASIFINEFKDPLISQMDQQSDGRKNRKRVYPGGPEILSKKSLVRDDEVYDVGGNSNQPGQGEVQVLTTKKALENSRELVSLEEYYYGTKESDPDILLKEERTENLSAKCPLCQTLVKSNIVLMKHILGHSEFNPTIGELSSLIQCKYCVQKFKSAEDLDVHLREKHKNFSTPLMCLICAQKFETRQKLIAHMHTLHTQQELPFQCSICFYRSSEQYKLVDHFYEIHAGGEKVQCPFCLKCVAISSNGKKMPANTFFFMHHVRKHQSQTSARRCDKCALWFVHKGILREHQSKDHMSFKHDTSVIPYARGKIDGIMMPLPGSSPAIGIERTNLKFTQKPFDSLQINEMIADAVCAECSLPFTADHVQSFMACLHCSFSTCCSNAMAKHAQVYHCKDRPYAPSNSVCNLSEEMYCSCGFKSKNGNVLATHLVKCHRQSAYSKPTSVSGQSASFPPLVSLEEGELSGTEASEKWIKAFSNRKDSDSSLKENKRGKEQPSMLNILGLVRTNSVEESSDKSISLTCTDDENSKGSNSSSTSRFRNRKRGAEEAGLTSVECFVNTSKDSSRLSNHTEPTRLRNVTTIEHSKDTFNSHLLADPDTNCKVSNLSEITVTQVSEDQ